MAELPLGPWLALPLTHTVYVPGEWVTLRCSAPRGEGVARYRFYKQPVGLIADGDSWALCLCTGHCAPGKRCHPGRAGPSPCP
ncbi:unnamed protein product [Natator depressus]